MKSKISKHFGPTQIETINKIGDIYTPGHLEFPSFSKLGCVEHIDRLLDTMPSGDRNDLKTLLTLLAYVPGFLLSGILALFEWLYEKNIPIPGVIRLIRIGLRGVIFSLYYSGYKGAQYKGKTPYEVLGYEVGVYLEDLPEIKNRSIKTQPQSAISSLSPHNLS